MSCRYVMFVAGTIGLAVFVSTSASAGDVPGMRCSEIGSFARQVAEHKAEGISIDEAIRRLRESFGSKHLDTEHELEKIVRAIYGVQIFSTASPEEVGTAYRTACEMGWQSPGILRDLALDGYGAVWCGRPLGTCWPGLELRDDTAQQLAGG